jgi:hypothetical protein
MGLTFDASQVASVGQKYRAGSPQVPAQSSYLSVPLLRHTLVLHVRR